MLTPELRAPRALFDVRFVYALLASVPIMRELTRGVNRQYADTANKPLYST